MKIITMATLKGGAGKTMNAFNIAGIVAEKKKVLLIDVDPQCNLSSNCGVDISERESYSIKDVFENPSSKQPEPQDIIIKSPIAELPKLDIIPSSIYLFKTEKNLYTKGDKERILQKYITKYEEYFSEYDYIIIDTNPSMSVTNINALLIADEIILSCDVSANSLMGAELFCELWDEEREDLEKEDNISAMLISNYDSRSNLAKDLSEYTQQTAFSKDIVLKQTISTTVKLKETEASHLPINILYPKQKACKQYREVVKELKKREVL